MNFFFLKARTIEIVVKSNMVIIQSIAGVVSVLVVGVEVVGSVGVALTWLEKLLSPIALITVTT